MGIDQDDVVSPDTIGDWKTTRTLRETLPILIILFTPITVSYEDIIEPIFSVFFFFVRLDFMAYSMRFDPELIGFNLAAFIMVSGPALIVSIFSSWMLRRLSGRITNSRRVLMVMIGMTIVWAIYLSIFFFLTLFLRGRVMLGPFPIPFGPIAAVLSRDQIMKMTEQIDELEKSNLGLVDMRQ